MVGYAGSPTYTAYVDMIQGQGQGHGAFELPTTSEAVHAGGDDRSPLAGLSGIVHVLSEMQSSLTHLPRNDL